MYSIFLLCACLLFANSSHAQINAYAKVTTIVGNNLSLSNVNESFSSFEVGDRLLIIQIQDNTLGSTANNNTFGDLGSIQSAGLYELATILAVNEIGTVPVSIDVQSALGNSYNFNPNSAVQIVSYPNLGGGGDFSTTANIVALPWDGNIGGVVAFEVSQDLILNHNITADGAGFRGGARSTNFYSACDGTTFFSSATNRYGGKGEGIHKNTNAAFNNGKGKLVTAGGGGNDVNAGGGGGGNFTAGGAALRGWSCPTILAGGIGGVDLSLDYPNRIFFGGGGGGGHQNNNVATVGGRGGGIIFISADSIRSTGVCATRISTNGITAINAGNDGAGGGGAGGAIVLNVNGFDITGTCPLSIEASGGNGGNVFSSPHGGGGGGSKGAIVFSGNLPTTNVTINNSPGTGGCDGSACPTTGEPGSPTALSGGTGVFANTPILLPITLVRFGAEELTNEVLCSWETASETDLQHFFIQRSVDALQWNDLEKIQAKGGVNQNSDYQYWDSKPLEGLAYYRLKIVSMDGSHNFSEIVAIERGTRGIHLILSPNPANSYVSVNANKTIQAFRLTNSLGQNVLNALCDDLKVKFDVSHLEAGIYILQLDIDGKSLTRKLVIN